MKPYEKIRKEFIDEHSNEKNKGIIESNFYIKPLFESLYYDWVKDNLDYFEIYKKWVLCFGPYFSMKIKDKDLYILRKGILVIQKKDKMIVNKPLLILFLDIMYPLVRVLIISGYNYYKLEPTLAEDQLDDIVIKTASDALITCYEEYVKNVGYPDFTVAFIELFKLFFYENAGSQLIQIPDNDKEFINVIEKEWKRIQSYSDCLYGFEVTPVIPSEDIFRYLKLPFKQKHYISLRNTDTYKQIMNYVVIMASSSKPLPNPEVKIYFRNGLSNLFRPLIKKLINNAIFKKEFVLGSDQANTLEDDIMKELPKIICDFNYFYATIENLKKSKVSPFEKFIFPLNNWLVKLGHNSSLDEYPLTDYLSKKIKEKMKTYCSSDINKSNEISLDEKIGNLENEDSNFTLKDVIPSDKELYNDYIPDYDIKDQNEHGIGWKVDTFASIIKKSRSTLQRWDRKGFLKAKRHEVGRGIYKTRYRLYTQEDINKSKEIEKLMKKRIKHQK